MKLLVNTDVDDLERGIAFYTDGLGLQLRRRLFDGSVAELSGVAIDLYLLSKPAGSQASLTTEAMRDYARHWTPVHLDFAVDDVAEAAARAVAAGATLEGDIQTFDWGTQAMLSDPFGNGFCLLHFDGPAYAAA